MKDDLERQLDKLYGALDRPARDLEAEWKHRTTRRTTRRAERNRSWAAWGTAAACLAIAAGAFFYFRVPARPPDEPVAENPPVIEARPSEGGKPPVIRNEKKEKAPEIVKESPKGPSPSEGTAPPKPQPKDEPVKGPESQVVQAPENPPQTVSPARPRDVVTRVETVIARLDRVEGEVYVISETSDKKIRARAGQDLLSGRGLQTEADGSAIVKYPDATRLKLGTETIVRRLEDSEGGKQAFLERGMLTAEVPRQPAERPLVLSTPHGKAVVPRAQVTLSAVSASTQVDVAEGERVRLTREDGRASVEVAPGQFVVVAVGMPLVAQDPPKKKPKVDQMKVDAAIKKGVEYLKRAGSGTGGAEELVFLTYVHAGVAENDPDFERLLKDGLGKRLSATYNVSLLAMALEELDSVKYQLRLLQCGQFLADNQSPEGFWGYGQPTNFVDDKPVPTGGNRKDVASGGGGKEKDPKPKVTQRYAVRQKRSLPGTDNSNSGYAALGMRACYDGGIDFEKELIQRAQKWWRNTQHPEQNPQKDPYGGYAGWCYGDKDHAAYGSMTTGAVAGLCIYDYILKENWKQDKWVNRGINWMAKNFTVKENPGPPEHSPDNTAFMHYYYLYGIERAGILYGTEMFGRHEWYPEGARFLIEAQGADGSWVSKANSHANAVWDTCWAILFLRRATRPLKDVETGGSKR